MAQGTPPFVSHFDGNQVPTMMGVVGTLGTADTGGTAESLPIGVNPATGALFVQDLSGAGGTTNVLIIGGTLQAGTVTVGSIANVGVVHNAGSLANGSLSNIAMLHGGTVNASLISSNGTILRVGNVGTLELGSVIVSSALPTGANNIGDVDVATGTVTLVSTVTTVSNLTNGTTRISAGTVGGAAASGAAASGNPNLAAGTDSGGTIYTMLVDTAGNPQVDVVTIPQVSVGTIPQVSVGTLSNVPGGTLGLVTTVSNLTNGSVNILTGTVTAVSSVAEVVKGTTTLVTRTSNVGTLENLDKGTITRLEGGTLGLVTTVSNLTNGSVNILTGTVTRVSNVGTLESGTVQINPVPVPTMLLLGTQGTAGGSFFATISAASGAGTKHYVSHVDIVVESGTADVRVLAGSAIQGTGVLAGGKFVPSAGVHDDFSPAFATGTNSELIYHFVGAGTAFIKVYYWKGV